MRISKDKKDVTVSSIAKDLGLSASTVSFVLTGQAKKHHISTQTANLVKNHAKSVGYVPNFWARGLKKNKSNIISAYFADVGYWSNDIIRGISQALKNKGYTFMLNVNWGEPQVLEDELKEAISRRDEGVIIHPILVNHDYSYFIKHKIPTVFVSDIQEDFRNLKNISLVEWNVTPAIELVVNRFRNTGKNKVGFIGSHYGMVSDMIRFQAYKAAAEKAKLIMEEEWVVWLPYPITYSAPDFDDSLIKEHIEKILLNKNRPEAMFILNDFLAVKILSIISETEINIPNDISIISVGDLMIAEHVGLTTLVEPRELLGQVTGETLLNIIEGQESPNCKKKVEFSELKIRNTG